MKSLRECIAEAREKKIAIGHFNFSNLETLWGIFNAAKNLGVPPHQNFWGGGVPVIAAVSEGEEDYVGTRMAVAAVRAIREEHDYPIYLNADHHYSFERVKNAIDAGFDAVIFDGAKLPLDENIKITKQCVDYARRSGRDVLVEGELGYIGQSSKVLDAIPEGAAIDESELTTVGQAKQFISETGVDLFSPAIGSIHGMLRKTADPDLNIKRLAEISAAVETPLVLHGGSGLTDENFTKAIANGISVVHINTEIRVAWKNAIKLFLQENTDEATPYKIGKPAMQAVEKVVEKCLKLFNKQ